MIKQTLISKYQQVRQATLNICSHIENEDFVVDVKEYWHFDYGNAVWAIGKKKKEAFPVNERLKIVDPGAIATIIRPVM